MKALPTFEYSVQSDRSVEQLLQKLRQVIHPKAPGWSSKVIYEGETYLIGKVNENGFRLWRYRPRPGVCIPYATGKVVPRNSSAIIDLSICAPSHAPVMVTGWRVVVYLLAASSVLVGAILTAVLALAGCEVAIWSERRYFKRDAMRLYSYLTALFEGR
jgi:hypothetical protein